MQLSLPLPTFSRERVEDHADPAQALKDFLARQKMNRVGTPDEVASLVTYLASDEVIHSLCTLPIRINCLIVEYEYVGSGISMRCQSF